MIKTKTISYYSKSDFKIIKKIDQGGYGKIYLAINVNNNSTFILKKVNKSKIIKKKFVDHLFDEVHILNLLCSEKIYKFYGLFHTKKSIFMVLEYLDGYNLSRYLDKFSRIPINMAKEICLKIVSFLDFMHNQKLIYRDLKPDNIFLENNNNIKFIDFGFAKSLRSRTYTICGTPEYIAPEILLNNGYGFSADWWSLGVVLYEMLFGITPFLDSDPYSIYKKILKGSIIFPKSSDKKMRSIIRHILEKDITKRYGNMINGSRDILNHRFFSDVSVNLNDSFLKYKEIKLEKNNISNKKDYIESDESGNSIISKEDPFLNW